MNLKTRIKFTFQFLGYVILNFFNSIAIVIVYILLIPFCLAFGKILTQAMKDMQHVVFHDNKADPEALELMKELVFEYKNIMNDNGVFYSWAVCETIKYLEKHNIKIGE